MVVSLLAGMICSMAITNHPRAYDGGSQRRYPASPTGRKIIRLRSDDPLPGGPYTLIQLAVLPVRAALGVLVLVCSVYLVLFVTAKAFPTDQGRVFAWLGEVLAEMRDGFGHLAALGGTPSPLTAAIVGVGAVVGGNVLRSVPRLLDRSRIDRDLSLAEKTLLRRLAAAGEPLDDDACQRA